MKYIHDGERGFDHRPYWAYLRSVKEIMPTPLFEFASNPDNHDLTSPNSLHDSWLEHWRVSEIVTGENRRFRDVQIEACFLGPRHDRYIFLTYKNVRQHSISAGRFFPYGDLLLHEMTIEQENLYSHEVLFANGSTILVHFSDFEHRIEALDS